MKEQLLRSWQTHQRMNLLLFDAITDAGMQVSLSPRGRTVADQFFHLNQVRFTWLQVCGQKLKTPLKKTEKPPSFNRNLLRSLLEESSLAILELIDTGWEAGGKISGFKPGLIPFISYLISHESHHRGNMLLTLKQSGEKIPDSVKFGIWAWDK